MKCKDKYKNKLFLNELDFRFNLTKIWIDFSSIFFFMLNFKKKKDFEMKQILNFFKYLYKNFYENN